MIAEPLAVQRAIALALAEAPADHVLAAVGTYDATGAQVVVVLKKDPHWALLGGVAVSPARAATWTAGVMWSF